MNVHFPAVALSQLGAWRLNRRDTGAVSRGGVFHGAEEAGHRPAVQIRVFLERVQGYQ